MTAERRWRFNRADFGPLPATLDHMDLSLNFLDGRVHVVNRIRVRALTQLGCLRLDARDLEIHAVEAIREGVAVPLPYEYSPADSALSVRLPTPLAAGTLFTLQTRTTCVPSDSVLEGIYKDSTPPGCPQQYVSQCQQ